MSDVNETHYVVVENGMVINRVVSDVALEPNWIQHDTAQIGWSYDGVNFIPPPPPPPPPDTWVISKIAFISRMSSSEYIGIVTATSSDPAVKAWYDMLFLANAINLQDQRTIDGVNFMVSKNLLAQETAQKILTTPCGLGETP